MTKLHDTGSGKRAEAEGSFPRPFQSQTHTHTIWWIKNGNHQLVGTFVCVSYHSSAVHRRCAKLLPSAWQVAVVASVPHLWARLLKSALEYSWKNQFETLCGTQSGSVQLRIKESGCRFTGIIMNSGSFFFSFFLLLKHIKGEVKTGIYTIFHNFIFRVDAWRLIYV